jgi:hypothetical protein
MSTYGISDRMLYVDVTPASTATYARVGAGFNTATPTSTSEIKTTRYINETLSKTNIIGKALSYAVAGERVVGDTFNDFFCTLFDKTGDGCKSTLVVTDAWDSGDAAKKYNVTIDCTNNGGGAAADGLTIAGTIYINEDGVPGTFNKTTNTFTPNS